MLTLFWPCANFCRVLLGFTKIKTIIFLIKWANFYLLRRLFSLNWSELNVIAFHVSTAHVYGLLHIKRIMINVIHSSKDNIWINFTVYFVVSTESFSTFLVIYLRSGTFIWSLCVVNKRKLIIFILCIGFSSRKNIK